MIRFVIFFTLSLTACMSQKSGMGSPPPPELTSIHIVDRNGMTEAISAPNRLQNYQQVDFLTHQPYQKVLRVFSRDEDGNIPACITAYHSNGQIKQYLEVMNNRAFGSYKEWFPSGTPKVDACIVEGVADLSVSAEKTWLFDGPAKAYEENGTLVASIPYQRGCLEGTAIHYHPSGSVWKEIPYKSNAISGEMKVFLESGELLQTTCYDKGIKSGKSNRFWSQDKISSEEWYEQGRLFNADYYGYNGNKVAEIRSGNGFRAVFGKNTLSELHEYKNGMPEGSVTTFTSRETLSRIYHVKNGAKHGEELLYYPSNMNEAAKPKLSLSWYMGKVQGLVKSWYDNGVMENKREMSENERNGVSTAWYRDGQLMMIEEYEHGKLQKGDYYRKGNGQPVSQVLKGDGTVTLFDSEGSFVRKIPYFQGKPEE